MAAATDGDWLLDLECMIVETFHWSLFEIDQTDMESLLPFVLYYPHWKGREKKQDPAQAYADQVDWL